MSRRSLLLQVALVAAVGLFAADLSATQAATPGGGSANASSFDGGSMIIRSVDDRGHMPMVKERGINVTPTGHLPITNRSVLDEGLGGILLSNIGGTSGASLWPKFEDLGDKLGDRMKVQFEAYAARAAAACMSLKTRLCLAISPDV